MQQQEENQYKRPIDEFDNFSCNIDFHALYGAQYKQLLKMKKKDIDERKCVHRLSIKEDNRGITLAWYEALLDEEELLNQHLSKVQQKMSELRNHSAKKQRL